MKFKFLTPQLFFLFTFQCVFNTQAQTKENSLNEVFDKAIGKGNLGINNGTLHLNNLRSFDMTHRYMVNNYISGDVLYDGQTYTNVSLKYDLLKDILIAKAYNNDNLGINLITAKTNYFVMNGKRLVNLNFNTTNNPKFIAGFYELNDIDNKLTLYIKHHKEAVEVLTQEGISYKFTATNEFIVGFKGQYFKFDNQSDAEKVFPDFENEIDNFYDNAALEKENKVLFLKTLLKKLSNLLQNQTN